MVGQDPVSLLRGLERDWREWLRSVNLVAELQIAQQELNTALYCLGLVWRRQPSAAHARSRIAASYPGSFVVAVAGSASMHLEGHRVLPQLFEAAGLRHDGNLGREWGKLFLECLQLLRLPTFEELDSEQAKPYVSRMLLHGGIPIDHVDEWFEVATAAVRALPDGRASELQTWMVQRAAEKRLHGSTTSIDRFLRFGKQYAADFLDRSLELLDAVQNGAEFGEISVGLPPRYVRRAIELRELDALPAQQGRDRLRGVAREQRPDIRFDPYGFGVYLRLPPVPKRAEGVTWRTSIAGHVESLRLVPSRPNLPTEPAEVPIPVGVADITVQLNDDPPTVLRLVDPDDPVLLFGTDEVRLPNAGTLPRGTVWVVRPSDREVVAERGRLVELHETVARWRGWSAELWDLSEAISFQLKGARRHGMQTERTARLTDVREVAGLTSVQGFPVLSSWPSLELPAAAIGTSWSVRLGSVEVEGGTEVELDVGTEGRSVDLEEVARGLDLEGRPVLVRARGPLGRSLRRSMLVLPGLSVVSTPAVRTLGPEGLSPARVELVGADHDPVVLPADQLAATVQLGVDQELVLERSIGERRIRRRRTQQRAQAPSARAQPGGAHRRPREPPRPHTQCGAGRAARPRW
jgi:hypothetical protein